MFHRLQKLLSFVNSRIFHQEYLPVPDLLDIVEMGSQAQYLINPAVLSKVSCKAPGYSRKFDSMESLPVTHALSGRIPCSTSIHSGTDNGTDSER